MANQMGGGHAYGGTAPMNMAPHPSTATPGAGRPAPTPVRTNPNNKKK